MHKITKPPATEAAKPEATGVARRMKHQRPEGWPARGRSGYNKGKHNKRELPGPDVMLKVNL